MNDITDTLRQFVATEFLFGEDEVSALSDTTSFLESGVIDSTGVLELVGYLHRQFGIEMEDEEIIPENLDSLVQLTRFVERKLAAAEVMQ